MTRATTRTTTRTAGPATGPMTEEQTRRAEQIVRRWLWAVRLSTPADRAVEQGAVGEMAVALLDQLLRGNGSDDPATRR